MFYQKCEDVFLSSTLFFFYLLVNIWIFVNLVWPFGILIHEVSGSSCPEPAVDGLRWQDFSFELNFDCTNGYFEGSVCTSTFCQEKMNRWMYDPKGSRNITCTNTGRRLEWTYSPTEGRPACPGACLHPDSVYAGGRGYIEAQCFTFLVGSVCSLYCFNGNLTGARKITCNDTGSRSEWTYLATEGRPSCPDRCNVRAWDRNFEFNCSADDLDVGAVCDVSCKYGDKQGKKVISMTCNTNGSHMEWTSSTNLDTLACPKEPTCGAPVFDPPYPGDALEGHYRCDEGFYEHSSCTLFCGWREYRTTCTNVSGVLQWDTWNYKCAECVKPNMDSGALMMYYNGCQIHPDIGTVCTLSCRYGDPVKGAKTITCTDTGKGLEWTYSAAEGRPTCPATNCTLPEKPKNGALSCLRDSFGYLCMVICNDGYEVPRQTEGRFLCTFSKGYWQPNTHVPSCTRFRRPNVARVMTEIQYDSRMCHSTYRVQQIFLKALRNSTWRDACLTMTCNEDNIEVFCNADRGTTLWGYDRRRQANPHIATVSFEIVLGTGSSTLPAAELYQSIMSTKDSIFNTLNSEVQSGKFNMPAGAVTYGFKYPTIKAECPPGMLGKDTGKSLSCAGCGTGYYLAARADKCEPCPVGQYTDLERATSCTPCPTGKSTLSTGSHQLSDCKVLEPCPAGTSSSFGLMPCQDCPSGHYQSLLGSTYCRLCPAGTWTYNERSTSLEQCVSADVRLVKENLTARVAQQWTPLTLSMWLLLKNASSAEVIMHLDNSNSLYIHISSQAVEYLPNSDRSASVAVKTNTWNRVVLTVEPLKQTAALYLQTQHVHTFKLAGTRVSPTETSIQSTQGEVVISGLTAEVKAWSLSEITASSVSCAANSSNNVLSWTPPSLSAIKLPSDCDGLL